MLARILRTARALLGGVALVCFASGSPLGADTPSNVNIDLLVVYTPGAASLYSSGGIATRIHHLLAVANRAYADSEVGITLRLAQAVQVNYSDTLNTNTALAAIHANTGAFANVQNWRLQYGADMVVLLRPYCGDGIAGLGYLGGMGQQGNLSSSKPWMFTHVALNTDDYVLAHELGHNMGLVHSRKQDPNGGTWPYSAGYGVQGLMVDVMAYASAFGVTNAQKVYQFSSPLHVVNGLAFGVASSHATQGADAVASLNAVRASVSDFYTSKAVLSSRAGRFGGDARADLLRCDPDDGKAYLWITGTSSAPASGFGQLLDATVPPGRQLVACGDWDGDGLGDALLRGIDSSNLGWLLNSGTPTPVAYPSLSSSYWQVGGCGDLDGDGDDDLVWRNAWTGANSVWLMNGAAAPTQVALGAVTDLKWRIEGVGDVDGDGKCDLVWRHYGSGKLSVWLMNGATLRATALVGTLADLNWKAVGCGDFDGDGHADVLFNHATSAANQVWCLNGPVVTHTLALPAQASTAWRCTGIGDFDADGRCDDILWNDAANEDDQLWIMNGSAALSEISLKSGKDQLDALQVVADLDGDGRSELVWRNAGSGANSVWELGGAFVSGSNATDALAGSTLRVVRAGDFDGDGKQDLLWRDSSSGAIRIWRMDGASVLGKYDVTTVADPNNVIAAVGDLDGDGKDDIVLRHATSGANTLWRMNGGSIGAVQALLAVPDTNWKIGGAADFDHDGRADLVWRNYATGKNALWLMNGATRTSAPALTQVSDLQWKLVGTGDFDGDGNVDLLWRHGANGKNSIWFLNGTSVGSTALATARPDLNWVVEGVGDFDADGRSDILWRNNATRGRSLWLQNGASLTASGTIY